MPEIGTKKCRCALCGYIYEYAYLAECTEITLPDTDLRPAMMKRVTMDLWTHTCPVCGFIERDGIVLQEPLPKEKIRRIMRSSAYTKKTGLPALAETLIREGMLREACDDPYAYQSILQAAWVCDDDPSAEDESADLRRRALQMIEDSNPSFRTEIQVILQYADMLRRIGEFERTAVFCRNVQVDNTELRKVLELQMSLAEGKISGGGYTLRDAGINTLDFFTG